MISNLHCKSDLIVNGCVSFFLGAFAKLRKAIVRFIMSVRPNGTTRILLDGF
jgi:hypothetical protein